ncbi:MAG: translocation/assembly module TamB domain-containing protein, partial [Chroococcales cyanobacterium]
AGGTIQATNVQLANQRFRANLAPTNVNIGQLFEQFEVEGDVTGQVAVNANLNNLTPAGIQAQGQLTFSEGLPSIPGPLQTAFTWTGQRLQIQQATAPGFDVSGIVDVNLARQGAEALQRFNLNVNAQGLNLAELPFELPGPFADFNPTGLLDFQGTVAGTPTQPNVQGQLALRNFDIDGLQLDPVLAGTVDFAPGEGIDLQLAGEDNQIEIALGPNNQIQRLLVRTDDALITGRQQGDLLLVESESFPIGLIDNFVSLPPAIANQPIAGELSGELAVNPRTFEAMGEILVTNPVLGRLSGDRLTADFTYRNGRFLLDQAQFIVGESEYLAEGQFVPTPQGPRFQAQIQLAQARIEDTLVALQVFDLSDLIQPNVPITGTAESLNALSLGAPESTLLTQLRRLSEVEAYLTQQQREREEATPLPPIAQLEGSITGTLNVVGSPTEGIEAAFNLQGQEWDWGPYDINQVLAEGTFQDGVLTLIPLRFEFEDALIAFSGTVGGETQSGQLRLESVPVSFVQEFVDLPPGFGLSGEISALATLAGSQANPQAIGELVLSDATINQTPIPALETSFRYNNARLNFFATGLFSQEADPLAIRGSIPYQLPFATAEPENNELSLQVNLENNALALLDVLTRQQVNWIAGQGNVELDISGSINPETSRPVNLIAQGVATIDDATIRLQALPEEPLTDVTGNILFNFDQIQVQELRGDFSGGQLIAQGTIPINTPQPQENPLTVQLGQLALNLKGLYQGGVRGNVVVTGTALEPELGGNIDLLNGRILIAEAARGETGLAGETEGGFRQSVGFNDLLLTLAEDVQVTQPPLLNFLAAGDLTLGGTLADIRPEGIIRLKRGQVNLFTTQFRLAGGYEQTAQFFPERGLNPYLDVRLVASVAEATRSPVLTDPLTPEVADIPTTDLGRVQTVRIQARVEGFATELTENLELTSNPPRSETELVSLLGGGFVETLGRGDTTLGLANLAGSALLGGVQNIIGDALGLSEFRLYPTVTTDDEERRSTLGLSAEASVDVTNRVSASIQRSLTTDEPARFGVRYRLNDEILFRGSVDPEGEGRAIVEYESRF